MREVMRDRTRRRYRHHWERAIAGLVAPRGAANGRPRCSRPPAPATRSTAGPRTRPTAEGAPARRPRRHGGVAGGGGPRRRDSARGRRRSTRPAPRAPAPPRKAAPAPRRRRRRRAGPAAPSDAADEDSPPDPALEAALADLAGGGARRARWATPAARAPRPSPRSAPGRARSTRASRSTCRTGWVAEARARARGRPPPAARPRPPPGRARRQALGAAGRGRQVDACAPPSTTRRPSASCWTCPGDDRVQLFSLDDPPRLIVDVGTHAARSVATPAPPTRSEERSRQPAARGTAEAEARPERERRASGGWWSTPGTAGTTRRHRSRSACARRT